jgi:PAS domain S-box-containing protein
LQLPVDLAKEPFDQLGVLHCRYGAARLSEPFQPNSYSEQERYRLLVSTISDYAIYMLDREGRVSSWNAGAQRFKGYRPEEIIGEHFSRFYTPEDQAAGVPARALETSARTGIFETEGWRLRKDGTRFWAHVVIDPIRDEKGDLIGYAKITRDLTERRKSEDALRRSEEQFKFLVQGVTDYAIYMLDTQGLVSNWNAGAERIKGYAAGEIIGQHFSRFYTEEDRAKGEPERGLGTAAREGKFEIEGWRVRRDGTRFWAHVVVDALRDESGVLKGFAKITRDITERRNSQVALDRAREALFQSQKTEAICRLTGGVAHDFNNLLMAVLGSLELLRKRLPDDDRMRGLLDNAMQGAQRGAALTQRMLSFARRQEVKLEPTEMVGLVRGMADLLERSLGTGVVIETRFPLRLPLVMADPNQFETALLNLVVNARDAMPEGGRITISARASADGPPGLAKSDRGFVCVSVEDCGHGMDAQTLASAAEPFFTTKGVGKGTGLGLPMVQGTIELFGGKMIIDSRVGKGTTVHLWLPVAQGEALEKDKQAQEHALHAMKPLVILAVDDDSLVLLNTVALLEDLGHTVYKARGGKFALEVMARQHVDLVITDHIMPLMTGLQLAEAIRAMHPKMPILLATGYAELPAGANWPRLSKPFGQKELARAIGEVTRPR